VKVLLIYNATAANKRTKKILPEGHRTLDGNLGDSKRLPFHLAKQAGVPIISIGISGLYQLKRKGSWFIRPRPVSIKFGEPVDRDTIQALSVEELRFHIRSKIQDLVE
jgi:1-acyl-sn-glycerol-3-phosphate acyltransferase